MKDWEGRLRRAVPGVFGLLALVWFVQVYPLYGALVLVHLVFLKVALSPEKPQQPRLQSS